MAADDPYMVLGIKRDAGQEDIRRAYRKLAKQHHPDLNPGKKEAEARFKSVSAAYDLLSDPEKRARFDRGEIDANGSERHGANYSRAYADAAQAGARHRAPPDFDINDVFADVFGERRRRGAGAGGAGGGPRARGGDRTLTLTVDFLEAVNGAKKRVWPSAEKSVDVTIPPGFRDGQVLRLQGQGEPGGAGGPAGDALIEVHVKPHPYFTRDDADIRIEVPITLAEAVLGAKINVPTVSGPVTMMVPKGSDSGTVLRLRGKGVPSAGGPRGDQYVTLKIVLGDKPDAELEEFIRGWQPKHPNNPRLGMGGS